MRNSLFFLICMFFSCQPQQHGFEHDASVYGSEQEALAHTDEAKSLIIRNVGPDSRPLPTIKQISPDITALTNLQNLTFYGYPSDTLFDFLGNLGALENLVIYGKITPTPLIIGNGLGNLKRLKKLHIDNAGVNTLGQIGNSVEHIAMPNNRFEEIPTTVFACSLLRTLNMSNNPIHELPIDVGNLKHLETLDLSHCNINNIEAVCQLSLLKSLTLSFNPINELPTCIGQLKQLERIELFECPIKTLPMELLQLPRLKQVWMSETLSETFKKDLNDKFPSIEFMFAAYRGR